MLTARAEAEHRIVGLEIGVDDYVAKPFEPRELLLRLQNILKRGRRHPGRATRSRMGDFTFHVGRGELKRGEETIKLTERERDLLRHVRPAARACRSPATSWRATASQPAASAPSTCRSTGCAARSRSDPANPVYLQTVRGKGYILYTD